MGRRLILSIALILLLYLVYEATRRGEFSELKLANSDDYHFESDLPKTPTVEPTSSALPPPLPLKFTRIPRPTEISDSGSSDETTAGTGSQGMAGGVVVGDRNRDQSGYYPGNNGSQAQGTGSGVYVNGREVQPEIAALMEAQRQYDSSHVPGLIGGVTVHGPTAVPTALAAVATSAPTATPVPSLQRLGGQARGYTMLYLMQPEARRTVEKQVEILLAAQLDEIYLGVLVDGTFTLDFEYLRSVIKRLSRVNRSLTLVLYLTNGPGMRATKTGQETGLFVDHDPVIFRDEIQFDGDTRNKFRLFVRAVVGIFDLNRRLNVRNKNFVVPMLEDNLDHNSYVAIRAIVAEVVGNRASIIRNPCPNCVDGSDADPLGDGLELHNPDSVATLGEGDGFTLDGTGYVTDTSPRLTEISADQVKSLAREAIAGKLQYFGLWKYARQGTAPGEALGLPSQRVYEVPSAQQAADETELLREGLFPIKTND